MPYLDDLRRYDHRHWEDPQSVTLTLPRNGETKSVETRYAFKMDASRARQYFGGVALAPEMVTWLIPDVELDGNTLEVGDTITEACDDTAWRIEDIQKARNDRQWVVRTVRHVTDG